MTYKILQKIPFLAIAMALNIAPIKISSVQAATVNYNFTTNLKRSYLLDVYATFPGTGNPDDVPFYSGFFSYDDSSLTGIGIEEISGNEGLRVFLQPYGGLAVNDADVYTPIPLRARFENGNLLGINAFFVLPNTSPVGYEYAFIEGQIIRDIFGYRINRSETRQGEGSGSIQYSLRNDENPITIPESSMVLGICFSGLASLVLKKVQSFKA